MVDIDESRRVTCPIQGCRWNITPVRGAEEGAEARALNTHVLTSHSDRPNRVDAIDATLTEAARLAMLALETLKQAKLLPNESPQFPLPRVRAITYLKCAAAILEDLG